LLAVLRIIVEPPTFVGFTMMIKVCNQITLGSGGTVKFCLLLFFRILRWLHFYFSSFLNDGAHKTAC
jgi:hypothetical protein